MSGVGEGALRWGRASAAAAIGLGREREGLRGADGRVFGPGGGGSRLSRLPARLRERGRAWGDPCRRGSPPCEADGSGKGSLLREVE